MAFRGGRLVERGLLFGGVLGCSIWCSRRARQLARLARLACLLLRLLRQRLLLHLRSASGNKLLGKRAGEVAMGQLAAAVIIVQQVRVGDTEANRHVKDARGGVPGVNTTKICARALRNPENKCDSLSSQFCKK